jgi:hypothetical protein
MFSSFFPKKLILNIATLIYIQPAEKGVFTNNNNNYLEFYFEICCMILLAKNIIANIFRVIIGENCELLNPKGNKCVRNSILWYRCL